MCAGVRAANDSDSSSEVSQEWAPERSSPSFIIQSLSGKPHDSDLYKDAIL